MLTSGQVHRRELLCRIFDGNEEVVSAEYLPMVLQFGLSEEYDRQQISRLMPFLSFRPEEHLALQVTVESLIRPRFQRWLRDLLMHMILSHHGHLEFGSPKVPVFPEALLLHLIDTLDAKMETMRSLIDRDPQVEGSWTGYNAALERAALKKDRYLNPPEPAAARPNQAGSAAQPPAQGNGGPRREPQNSPFASKLQDALKRDT